MYSFFHVTNHLIPGMGYQENYLSRFLVKSNINAITVTGTTLPSKFNHLELDLSVGSYAEDSTPHIRLKTYAAGPFQSIVILKNLFKLIKEHKPRVIYANTLWSIATLQLAFFKKKYGYKLIVDDHIDNANFKLTSLKKKIFFYFFKKIFPFIKKRVDLFVSVNKESYKILTEVYKIDHVYFFPLGVDSDTYYQDARLREEMRKKNDLKDDDFVIIISGNIDGTKSYDLLFQSFIELSKEHERVVLFNIGKVTEEFRAEFLKMTKPLKGLSYHHIEWIPQDELNKYYNMSDIGVMPGKLSGMKDCMAAALPLLISDDIGVRHLVASKDLMFERGEKTSFVERLSYFYQNRKHLQNTSEETKLFSQENLEWSRIVEKFVNDNKNLLEG